MDILDSIFFVVYALILYVSTKNKQQHKDLYPIAFGVKVVGALAGCYLAYFIIPDSSDSYTLYFPEGIRLYHLILNDIGNIKYTFTSTDNINLGLFNPDKEELLSNSANFMIVRIVAVLSFICLGKYFTLGLFFSYFALSGLWKMFLFFSNVIPSQANLFFGCIFLVPNIVLWSSGVLKDPIVIGSLGWVTYLGYEIVIMKRCIFYNLTKFIFFSYLIFAIKPHIILTFLPCYAFFLVSKKKEGINYRPIYNLFAFLSVVAVSLLVLTYIGEGLEKFAFSTLLESLQEQQGYMMATDGGSNFSLGVELDGTISSLIKIAPLALVATFFRPFVWESHSIIMLFTAMESSLLLLFCTYVFIKVGIRFFFHTVFNNPIVFFCLSFSMLFGLFIGATTLNFGTLVRYKMPCIPFFINAFIIILRSNQKNIVKPKNKNLKCVA